VTEAQLLDWGWRVPFLFGALVGIAGVWLRFNIPNTDSAATRLRQGDASDDTSQDDEDVERQVTPDPTQTSRWETAPRTSKNPFLATFALRNLRALVGAFLVATLFSGGFYILFVWLPVFMTDLTPIPVPNAFGVNCGALFLSQVAFFPFAGLFSDRYGRRSVMTFGAVGLATASPFLIEQIGSCGSFGIAFACQAALGTFLALWSAPMLSWFVESFLASNRLSSIAAAYNVAMAALGGTGPTVATVLADDIGASGPGYLVSGVAVLGLLGLWIVAPAPRAPASAAEGYERVRWPTIFPILNRRNRENEEKRGEASSDDAVVVA